jgi:lysophospholipase L1-like esterase
MRMHVRTAPEARRPPWARACVGLGALIVALLACEMGFRLLGSTLGVDRENLARYRRYVSGGGLEYEPRPHTVFARPPRSKRVNSLGFIGAEWSLEKKSGVPRILCLGGSTTEGGNQEGRPGQYPFQLGRQLGVRTGRHVEVLNAGMSAWTTAETLVAWFLLLQHYEPDLVIIHHAINDVAPRFFPGFRVDYTHWRRPMERPRPGFLELQLVAWSEIYAWLRMDGAHDLTIGDLTTQRRPTDAPRVLAEGSEVAFRMNVESIALSAEARGAAVLLLTMPMSPAGPIDSPSLRREGTNEHNQILRDLANQHGWLLADAARWPGVDPDVAAREVVDVVHLTKAGNALKARVVADVLVREWVPELARKAIDAR